MHDIFANFHIELKLIIAQFLNFGLVFFVLYRFVIKPIRQHAEQRSDEITKGLNDAKEYKELLLKNRT